MPYTVSGVTISATSNSTGASVSGTGSKNLSVGANIFTVSVTALDKITKINYTVVVTREQDPNAPTPTSIEFDLPSYEATIPDTGSTTVTVSAIVKDQFGNVMQGVNPTYSVSPSYSGLTVDSATGVITVTSSAAIGTANIRVSYGSINANASLTLSKAAHVGEPHYELYFNNGWYVIDDYGVIYYEEAGPGVYEITMGGGGSGDYTYTFSAFASGIDAYGNPINVDSIVYVLSNGLENEAGVFGDYDVYDSRLITAIATFSDGKVLETDAYISITFIQPRR